MGQNKSEEIIKQFFNDLNISYNKNFIIIPYKAFIFELPRQGNLINVYLRSCYDCPVDCYKKVPAEFNDDYGKFMNKILKKWNGSPELSENDIILLSKVATLKKEPKKILKLENVTDTLTSKTQTLKFVLIGLKGVGKSTIFKLFPGLVRVQEPMAGISIKTNETFKPMIIELWDVGTQIIEKILSETVAPIIKSKFSDVYMFILVTDSNSKNIMTSKINILPKLSEINSHALIVNIANKQDALNSLNYQTIENILNIRTYPLVAIDPKSYELFMNMIWETIIIRIEQLKEYNCFYF